MTDSTFSDDLLELSRVVLEDEGYAVDRFDMAATGSQELLVAENPYFVLAAASAPTIDGLGELEAIGSAKVVKAADEADLGSKRWDVYLILMTSQGASDDRAIAADLVSINYNTHQIRRLARVGVQPTLADVRIALTPFLPIPEPTRLQSDVDVLEDLRLALVTAGVASEVAGRAIAAFRESDSLDNV